MWVEMKVRGLALDPVSNMPIIILRDEEEKRSLPIWVGIFEANAIALELDDPEVLGFGHLGHEDLRIGPGPFELRCEPRDPFEQDVVAQVHQERFAADEVCCREHRVGQSERLGLLHERHLDPPSRAVADGGPDLLAGRPHDDRHLGDAGRGDRLERVEQDRFTRDGDQLLRARVRDRAQPRGSATREHEGTHAGESTVRDTRRGPPDRRWAERRPA